VGEEKSSSLIFAVCLSGLRSVSLLKE